MSILLAFCIILHPVLTLAEVGGEENMPLKIFESIRVLNRNSFNDGVGVQDEGGSNCVGSVG
jgi:hypothetical protein